MYDSIIYQMVVRSFHEIFGADTVDAIHRMRFNGYVRKINKATGLEEVTYIITASSDKESFMRMNLRVVDVKACFRGLPDASLGEQHRFQKIELTEYVTVE